MKNVKEPAALRFWRWANRYSERKLRRAYGDFYKSNTMCPKCRLWRHQIPAPKVEQLDVDGIYRFTCSNCGDTSVWHYGIAPCPIHLENYDDPNKLRAGSGTDETASSGRVPGTAAPVSAGVQRAEAG